MVEGVDLDGDIRRARELLDAVALYLEGMEWDIGVATAALGLALKQVDAVSRETRKNAG
jgi:hypothetical protein